MATQRATPAAAAMAATAAGPRRADEPPVRLFIERATECRAKVVEVEIRGAVRTREDLRNLVLVQKDWIDPVCADQLHVASVEADLTRILARLVTLLFEPA